MEEIRGFYNITARFANGFRLVRLGRGDAILTAAEKWT